MSDQQNKPVEAKDSELTEDQLAKVTGGASPSEIVITKPTDTTSPK